MSDLDTALMLRMEASLSKFEKQMARAKKVGTDTAVDLERRFEGSNKKMARSAESSAQAIGREMDRLRTKYDPLFAASKRYEAELADLNRAHKVGALSIGQYDAALERINDAYARASGGAQRLAGAASGVARTTRGMSGGIQNVAYQVGDFAVQVGAGTSASMALGQQLPQLLGGFGVLGAVLGAAVAIGVPLAANFIDLGDNAKSTGEKIDRLQGSVDRLKTAMKEASSAGREDLKEAFGEVTASILAMVEAEKQMALLQSAKDLREASDALASFSDTGLWGSLAGYAANAGGEIRKMSDELSLSHEDARTLYQAFRDIEAAEGPRATADAFARVRSLLLDAVGGYSELNAAQVAFIENLNKAQRAAETQADLIAQAESATQGLITAAWAAAEGFAGAIGPVDTLIGKVAALAKNAWSYANAMAEEAAGGPISMPASITWAGGDPTQVGAGTVLDMGDGSTVTLGDKPKPTFGGSSGVSRGGGGGGGSSASAMPGLFATSDDQLQNLQRQIDMIGKTRAEVARMTSEYALLDEARKRGLDLDARQTASGETLRQEITRQADTIGKLSEAKDRAAEKAQQLEQAQVQLKDSLIDAIVEGEGLSGVLENLAKSLAKAALQAALFGDGGGGGLLGGLVSAIFPSAKGNVFSQGQPVQAFANGGVVNGPTTFPMRGGRTGLMGEAGPEAIMPLTRGSNGKLGVQAEGGGRQQVEILLRAPEGFTAEQIGQVQGISLRVAETRIGANNRAQSDARYLGGGR